MTRANHAGAMDAKRKLQEIAAQDLGGSPDDYTIGNERVFRKGNPSRGLTYAQAATRAIALGGTFDGHELPADIHAVTKAAAALNAGLGLMGVAKDVYPRDGDTYSFVAGFAEVEVDVETGVVTLVDFSASATSARSSIRAAWSRRSTAAAASASRTRCIRSWSTTRTTACRWRGASITTSR